MLSKKKKPKNLSVDKKRNKLIFTNKCINANC